MNVEGFTMTQNSEEREGERRRPNKQKYGEKSATHIMVKG